MLVVILLTALNLLLDPLKFCERYPQRKEAALSVALYEKAKKGKIVFVANLPVKPFNVGLSLCRTCSARQSQGVGGTARTHHS